MVERDIKTIKENNITYGTLGCFVSLITMIKEGKLVFKEKEEKHSEDCTSERLENGFGAFVGNVLVEQCDKHK